MKSVLSQRGKESFREMSQDLRPSKRRYQCMLTHVSMSVKITSVHTYTL